MVNVQGAVAAACAAAFVSIGVEARERCVQRPGEHYDGGVAFHLARKGIPHRIEPDRGVCVAEELASELQAAAHQVDYYFWEVAHLLRSDCEEQTLVEWARKEELRYDVGDVYRIDGQRAGRMFHLRSYTYEEVIANRRKLDEAPQKLGCTVEDLTASLGFGVPR